MAIKIIGTTVVNDSRQLQNIASLDATTSATISSAVGGGGGGGGLDSAAVSNLVDSDYVRLHQVGALIDSDVPTSVKAGDLWYDKSDGTLTFIIKIALRLLYLLTSLLQQQQQVI